jgi:hypothetical protein
MKTVRLSMCLGSALLIAAGCASRPEIRLDRNPAADIHSYRTFGFVDPATTDESLYTTLISGRLRKATREELERRNYIYREENPDMRVSFSLNAVDRSVRRSMSAGLSGAHLGLGDLDTVSYRQGTLSIDVIDARRNELAWQGVAEGRISRKWIEEPDGALDRVVGDLFVGFPLNLKDGQLASSEPPRVPRDAERLEPVARAEFR